MQVGVLAAKESVSGLSVIITEKPDAATRIAGALSERPRKVASRGAYWYEFERDGRTVF